MESSCAYSALLQSSSALLQVIYVSSQVHPPLCQFFATNQEYLQLLIAILQGQVCVLDTVNWILSITDLVSCVLETVNDSMSHTEGWMKNRLHPFIQF